MNDPRVHDLIDRYFDCDLSGDDRASLERILLSSAPSRELFWTKAETHALLRKWGRAHWGRMAAANGSCDIPARPRPLPMRSGWVRLDGVAGKGFAAAAALIVVIVGATMLRGRLFPAGRPAIAETSSPAAKTPAFAVLTAAFQPVWADANVGPLLQRGALPTGPFELLSGRVELLFGSGGTAIIEGPASVELIARDALRLTKGYVRCRCAEPGAELRIETPSSAITDLGTEFAVSVDAVARTRVGVIEGKVRVDVAETSRLVTAGGALSIDADGTSSEDIGFWQDFSTKATFVPFDEAAFAAGSNILEAPAFDGLSDTTASSSSKAVQLGPWLGTSGHVEIVGQPTTSPPHAVKIHAKGSPSWPLVWQKIDTGDVAGKMIMASIRVRPAPEDPLVEPQRAIVKLYFLDAEGREFASAQRHFLHQRGTLDHFVEGTLAAEAPPGTVAIMFQTLLNAAGLPTGSIIVDDAKVVIAD
jgi:hypothetical protein